MIISENLLLNSDGSLDMDYWEVFVAALRAAIEESSTKIFVGGYEGILQVTAEDLTPSGTPASENYALSIDIDDSGNIYVAGGAYPSSYMTVKKYSHSPLTFIAESSSYGEIVRKLIYSNSKIFILGLASKVWKLNATTLAKEGESSNDSDHIGHMCADDTYIYYGLPDGYLSKCSQSTLAEVARSSQATSGGSVCTFQYMVTDGTYLYVCVSYVIINVWTYGYRIFKYACSDLSLVNFSAEFFDLMAPRILLGGLLYCTCGSMLYSLSTFPTIAVVDYAAVAHPTTIYDLLYDDLNEYFYAVGGYKISKYTVSLSMVAQSNNLVVYGEAGTLIPGVTTIPTIIPGDGFAFGGNAGMEQEYTPEEPEEGDPVINKYQLSAHYKITYEQDTTDPIVYNELYAKFIYDDGNFDTLVIPLRIDIDIPSKTLGEWLIALGTITIDTSKEIVNIIVGVAQYNPTATFTITDITLLAMVDDAVEEAQYFSNVTYQQSSEYTNEAINDLLGDVHAALEAIIGD
jgi:hypothetical protein